MYSGVIILTISASHALAYDARILSSTHANLVQSLDAVKADIDNDILLYQTPAFQWEPSTVYRYDDLLASINVMATEGVAGKTFYTGEDVENGHVYGLVNIAAFLAQSMKETIQYDACDENSWDLVNGRYPLSNACGQLGQSYQDYHCSEEEKHMECPVDPNMSITGVTHAKWYGAPGPLFCGPKTEEQPFSGFWDHTYECNKGWATPPETCDVYEGQKAGQYDQTIAVANTAGRTDVEGCCWWGRGVIQTSGVCNFGKLNYFLGAGAAKDGRTSRYPDIDFCKDPEIICSSAEYKELKWIAGMFYWIESVQGYNVDGWDYTTELKSFVDGGIAGNGFIDAVSGIVNRGCHNPPCATGAVDGAHERSQNFNKVLDTFFDGSPPVVSVQETIPSHQVLPPAMTIQDVGPNYGNSQIQGDQYVPPPPESSTNSTLLAFPSANSSFDATTYTQSSSSIQDEQTGDPDTSNGNYTSVPDEIILSNNMFTQEQTEDPNMSDESRAVSNNTQISYKMVTYSCREDVEPRMNTSSVEIPFGYKAIISRKANGSDATQKLMETIVHDIGSSLDCTMSSSRRNLRHLTDAVILGFQANTRGDDLFVENVSCEDLREDPNVMCITATGYLTAFFGFETAAADIEMSKQSILSIIEEGMRNNKYTSDDVLDVRFIRKDGGGDTPVSIQSAEATDFPSSGTPVWIPIIVTLLVVLIVVVNIVFIRRQKRRKFQSTSQIQPNHTKTLASFVSNLEGVPTPKIDSDNSYSSESIEESHLDCFEELDGPPFDNSYEFNGSSIDESSSCKELLEIKADNDAGNNDSGINDACNNDDCINDADDRVLLRTSSKDSSEDSSQSAENPMKNES